MRSSALVPRLHTCIWPLFSNICLAKEATEYMVIVNMTICALVSLLQGSQLSNHGIFTFNDGQKRQETK